MRRSLAAAILFCAFGAQQSFAATTPFAHATSKTEIRSRAGIAVVQDIIFQSSISFMLIGQPGDAVAVGVPGSVNVTNSRGDNLVLDTTSQSLLFAGGTVLAQDTVSISVGAEYDGDAEASSGDYNGLLVVLAQYN